MNVRTNVVGTMAPYFSIGKNGPTIFQGSYDPNTQSVSGHNGDLFVRVGATSHLYQFSGNTWVQVGTLDSSDVADAVSAYLANTSIPSANTLSTARTISVSGDATGSALFDGSANAAISIALANSGVDAGTYSTVTVDAKGRVTSGSGLSGSTVTSALGYTPVNPANATTISNALTVTGTLTVSGSTLTVDSTVTTIADPVLTLGSGSVATDDGKDRGIEFKYGNGTAVRTGFFGFDRSSGTFTVLEGATNASEVFTGTTGTITANLIGSVTGAASEAAKWTSARTLSLAGDASGSVTIDGTANASITVAFANSGATAGTYGNATSVATVAVDAKGRVTSISNTAITFPVSSVAGKTGAVSLVSADITDATSAATASRIVTRDTDGSFSANVVTARLSGIATTANAWTTARTFTFSGDLTASASVDGSADATFTTTLANSGATAGTYGNATSVPAVTVDAKGRVTSISNTAITFPVSSVAGKTGAVSLVSADITDATSASTANTIVERDQNGSFSANVVTARLSGIATTANAWTTARTFTLSGDLTASASVDGSAGVTFTTTLANSGASAGTYGNATIIPVITVDAKGRVTSIANVTATGGGAVTSVAGRTGAVTLTSSDITDATSANTANAIVERDQNGSFVANVATLERLSGNAAATVSQYRANTASLVLTTDQVWSAAGLVSLTDNTTVTVDFATGLNFTLTLGGNRTLANPTNTKVGQTGIIYVVQDGVGSKTLAYSSNYKFAGGSAPSLTTTANAVDRLIYFVRSSTHIDIDISRDRR